METRLCRQRARGISLKSRFNALARELRCRPVVVSQQPTKALMAFNFTVSFADFLARIDDLVAQPLMISFAVKMRKELADSISQRRFAEEDHPIQAFGLQTQVGPFEV